MLAQNKVRKGCRAALIPRAPDGAWGCSVFRTWGFVRAGASSTPRLPQRTHSGLYCMRNIAAITVAAGGCKFTARSSGSWGNGRRRNAALSVLFGHFAL